MADETQVEQVIQTLGPNAAANGWDETRVGDDLDAGLTPAAIALAWWRARVAMLADMMDVSESGSSRSLNQSFTNANAMVSYWQAQVNAEAPVDNPRGTLRSYPMRRV
jgi:hypothetical protein